MEVQTEGHGLFQQHCSTVSRRAQRAKPLIHIKDSVSAKLVATTESNYLDLYIQLTSVVPHKSEGRVVGGISSAGSEGA